VTDDDEWGKESSTGGGGAAVAEPEDAVVVTEVGELKNKLKELLYGTDRGLNASSETRAEIVELITQLEAKNPTPAPTEALPLLNGKWILA
jgi:PAP_fibrillin